MEKNCLEYYRELKEKHPDRLLLFRSGDFYQMFNEDAREGARILGIALAYFRNDPKTATCVFPHHELDTYLPRLIRAGKRVAICDLPDPKPTKKRGITELVTPKNNETMKLNIKNQNESANVANNAQVSNHEPLTVNHEPTVNPEPEVEDAVVIEENNPSPALPRENNHSPAFPREGVNGNGNINGNDPSPRGGREGVNDKLPKVTFSTYKTKKGDTAPLIIGFGGEDDVRWKSHKDQNHSYVSASYRRDISGEKVYILMFGKRYMEVAKALAGAYNTSDVDAWHRAEDACMAIYEQAQRDGKARWEEKKRHWAERKAERDAAKNKPKCYTAEDVAAMMKAFADGGDIPEDIQKIIAA